MLESSTDTVNSNGNTQKIIKTSHNSRHRGYAIGNAQNSVIRNILSNLGQESFNENDWIDTKKYFLNCCAYCGIETDLEMEHAIPINRQSLGEHRLGNLIPSCKDCNKNKGNKSFLEFLESSPERVQKIEEYMNNRNYVPLGDNTLVKMILNMAYKEVSSLADRYKLLLNELLSTKPSTTIE